MSKEFNHIRAWHELAKPAVENFNEKQKEVISELIPLIGELHQQGKDLTIPISPAMWEIIERLDTIEAAQLSQAIYMYGHWYPGKGPRIYPSQNGEMWKISNIMDQLLRKRLGFPKSRLEIHEGKFRVTFSNKNNWIWKEFALATEKNLEAFETCNLPFGQDSLEKNATILKKRINDIWDTDQFMDHKEGTNPDDDELKDIFSSILSSEFTVVKVTNVNYDPHIPVVGIKAMKHSTSGIIGGDAPCEQCGQRIDSHTSQKVIILKFKKEPEGEKPEFTEVQKELLKSIDELMKLHKLDGIAFTK